MDQFKHLYEEVNNFAPARFLGAKDWKQPTWPGLGDRLPKRGHVHALCSWFSACCHVHREDEFQERSLSDRRVSGGCAPSRLICMKRGRGRPCTCSESERRHQEDMWEGRECRGRWAVSSRAPHALALLRASPHDSSL